MLGKNIIQLQEELSYMPMQRLIDMVDDPNSIYGSLTLVEIKNREALQNSSTNMSPTPTVAEDVVSSVASPASTDLSSPNLSVEASGGIANLDQPQPPMQMMAEGRTVRLSDEIGEEFSLPPGGLMDLLGEEETPYLGDEEAITPEEFDELNQIEAEEDFKDMIDYERSNQETIPQAPISGLPVDLDVDVGDNQIDSLSLARDNFNVNLNKQGKVRGSYDFNPYLSAIIDAQNEDENAMQYGMRGSIPFSTGGLGYAEGGQVKRMKEGGSFLSNIIGSEGAFIDTDSPADIAFGLTSLIPIGATANFGIRSLKAAIGLFRAGKLSRKGMAQAWKKFKNPRKSKKDNIFTKTRKGAQSLIAKNPLISSSIAGYGIASALPGEPEKLKEDNSVPTRPMTPLEMASEQFGYPTADERESDRRRRLLMGLGSNIASATNLNDIVQGNYDIIKDEQDMKRQNLSDDLSMIQGMQALDPRIKQLEYLQATLEILGETEPGSERYNNVLEQLINLQAEISGQNIGQGITQKISETPSVAPTGGETLDNAQAEIQAYVNNLS